MKTRILCEILLALSVWGFGGRAEAAAELRGPLPILSVPYHDDGALDVETLVREARFVADAGVGGFIWCQSNDAIDLLTREEKIRSFAALARAFENVDVYVILGCQGRDTDEMIALATEVERLAAEHPATRLAIACRPPHDARSQDDLERYYRRLAGIARRPVIIQTYCSDKVPIPASELLIRLAREYPRVYGWIKEETGGADANARMRAECRAPEVKNVFSAWGSYGWLDQYRRFGTRGVISERASYADFLMAIWSALEAGDAARADDLFAKYLLMMNLRETIPGGHLRGFSLYVLKKRGIFKNYVSRDYVTPGDTSGKWKLETRVFTPDEIAEIEDRLSRLMNALDLPARNSL
jgi:1-pyrroline-4-hydroxy-2-carboxylate deaminase